MEKIIQIIKKVFCSYHTYIVDEEYWENEHKRIRKCHCTKCGQKKMFISVDYTRG